MANSTSAFMCKDWRGPGTFRVETGGTMLGSWTVEARDGWAAIDEVKRYMHEDRGVYMNLSLRGRTRGWRVTRVK